MDNRTTTFLIIFNVALPNCNRTDLVANFTKATIDLQALGKDGIDILIEKGWMEEIPLVADRDKIISLSHCK